MRREDEDILTVHIEPGADNRERFLQTVNGFHQGIPVFLYNRYIRINQNGGSTTESLIRFGFGIVI